MIETLLEAFRKSKERWSTERCWKPEDNTNGEGVNRGALKGEQRMRRIRVVQRKGEFLNSAFLRPLYFMAVIDAENNQITGLKYARGRYVVLRYFTVFVNGLV